MPGRLPPLRVVCTVVVASALVAGSAFAMGHAASAQTPSPTPRPGADVARVEDQVVLSGTATVPRGSSVGEVVVFHGRAIVAGVVVGDVVVLDGPVVILGQVSGSVVALNGPIRLASTASIGRDVLGAQGVRLEPGALVAGEVREDVALTPRRALSALGPLLGSVAIALSTLMVLLLLWLLAPRGLDRVGAVARSAPFASMGWGLVIAIVLPLLAVAAAVSIIGLPLGLALMLGSGIISLVGFALAAFSVGRLITREPRGRGRALLAGWGVAAAVGLVPFLNLAVWVAGTAFGLGAASVAIWRARTSTPSRGRHRVGYAPGHTHAPTPTRPGSHATERAETPVPARTTSSVTTGPADVGDASGQPSESSPATGDD